MITNIVVVLSVQDVIFDYDAFLVFGKSGCIWDFLLRFIHQS